MENRARVWREEGGFTLIELLIVMSIVGIMAVVAVPRFSSAIVIANTSRIQADLQALNTAIIMYQADNGDYPNNLTTDMTKYIRDVNSLRPPKGECKLRDGSTIEITATSYTLASDRSKALCQGHPVSDFGRKE